MISTRLDETLQVATMRTASSRSAEAPVFLVANGVILEGLQHVVYRGWAVVNCNIASHDVEERSRRESTEKCQRIRVIVLPCRTNSE
jgi:hypothetical protein